VGTAGLFPGSKATGSWSWLYISYLHLAPRIKKLRNSRPLTAPYILGWVQRSQGKNVLLSLSAKSCSQLYRLCRRTKNFWSMIPNLRELCTICSRQSDIFMFLFWPTQLWLCRIKCFTWGGTTLWITRDMNTQEAISALQTIIQPPAVTESFFVKSASSLNFRPGGSYCFLLLSFLLL
jgi:hypothetical protein